MYQKLAGLVATFVAAFKLYRKLCRSWVEQSVRQSDA
jgi:uncharacterized membrane protein YdjX (TVP38/TMEM64 family)